MKKVLIAVLIVVIIALLVIIPAGCKEQQEEFNSDFTLVIVKYSPTPTTRYVYLCYDKETKVMYILSEPGVLTPLYNADGTLRLYDGE